MDFPTLYYPPPTILTTFHEDMGAGHAQQLGSASSQSWTVANKALYFPFRIYEHQVAYQLLAWIGTAPAGNVDMALYRSDKSRIVSAGTTAVGTASTVQEFNIANTELPPGEYLLGFAASATAVSIFASSSADEVALSYGPIFEQTTALALPDPCVPVLCTDASPLRIAIGIQFFPTF